MSGDVCTNSQRWWAGISPLDGWLSADEPWWDFEQECRSAMVRARRIGPGNGGRGEGAHVVDRSATRATVDVCQPAFRIATSATAAAKYCMPSKLVKCTK